MAESVFRRRDIPVVLDTTKVAEFDVALSEISDEVMERIGRSLLKVTHSVADRAVGDVRVREAEGFDVVFIVVADGDTIRIVIARVKPPDPDNPTEQVLQKLGVAAIIRGAFGF